MTSQITTDSHIHLWRYTQEEFGWISDEMSSIRRDHLAPDLLAMLQTSNITQAVAVQARQSEEETAFLCDIARSTPQIAAVIGWVPLTSPTLPEKLAMLPPIVKGFRHVLQAEPTGFLDREDFNAGIRTLTTANFTFDLLIVPHQLPEATRLVARHPNQRFILNHLAKPETHLGLEPWATDIQALARHPNVTCKLSGGITEPNPHWTAPALRDYFDIALEVFTPARLMFGSNWPVIEATGGTAQWLHLVRSWSDKLSESERISLFHAIAATTYSLNKATS